MPKTNEIEDKRSESATKRKVHLPIIGIPTPFGPLTGAHCALRPGKSLLAPPDIWPAPHRTYEWLERSLINSRYWICRQSATPDAGTVNQLTLPVKTNARRSNSTNAGDAGGNPGHPFFWTAYQATYPICFFNSRSSACVVLLWCRSSLQS